MGKAEYAGCADAELAALKLAGDDRAFTELCNRYNTPLKHYITRHISDAERAADLTQETWMRIAKHLHSYDQQRKFSTWAYHIAKNLAKNELRDTSRSRMLPENSFADEAYAARSDQSPLEYIAAAVGYNPFWWSAPERTLRNTELHARLRSALDKLPEQQRRSVELRYFRGMTYDEIAAETGVELGTVKSRLHRATTALAADLEHLIAA